MLCDEALHGKLCSTSAARESLQTADVKGLNGLNVTSVQDPGLTTVQQDGDTALVIGVRFRLKKTRWER